MFLKLSTKSPEALKIFFSGKGKILKCTFFGLKIFIFTFFLEKKLSLVTWCFVILGLSIREKSNKLFAEKIERSCSK